MGYILLSPEHIEFTGEKEDKNWHLFKAKIEIPINDISEIYIEEEKKQKCFEYCWDNYDNSSNKNYYKKCIIARNGKIEIDKNPVCNNKKISRKSGYLANEDFKHLFIKYDFNKMESEYLMKYIEKFIEEHDKYDIEKYRFSGVGIYYTGKNRTFFYSDDEDTIRMLACMLRRCVCGSCIKTLYGDNKK